MFEIEYKGANCVVISTKKSKLVVDPKLSLVGLKDLSVKDSVELVTDNRFLIDDSDAKLIIDGPGEYGISDFDISGIPARRNIDKDDNPMLSTIYRVEVGSVRICIVGNINEKLSDDQLEAIGVVDILIVPVGGNGYTLDSTGAVNVTRSIDPKIVIPVHYADSKIKYEVPQNNLNMFLTEIGAHVEVVSKYKFKQLPSSSSVEVVNIELS